MADRARRRRLEGLLLFCAIHIKKSAIHVIHGNMLRKAADITDDNIVWEVTVDSDNNQAFLEEVAKRFKTWVIEKSKYEYPRLYESVSSTFAN